MINEKKYSLIIIGAGITGLSSAIAYAKNVNVENNPILILEQHSLVGGMVTSFKRKGYLFDTAQLIPEPIELFNYLEIDLPLKRFQNYFARIFLVNDAKTTEIKIPCGIENFKNMLIEKYPEEQKRIIRFFNYSKAMFNELHYLKVEPKLIDFIRILIHCPKIIKNRAKTFKEYFKSFGFKNKELEEIFDVFAAFSGLPAERTIAMMTIAAMNTSLIACYRPEKGFIQLPISLKKKAEYLGCNIQTKSEVNKIIIENERAIGVELNNGDRYFAENIITTVDTKLGMEKLVGLNEIEKVNPKYSKKIKNVKMSASSITIGLGLDDNIDLQTFGLDCGYNVITTGKNTFENLFKAFDNGEYLLDENNFHCAVICPSLTTKEKPTLIIRIVPIPMAKWKNWRENDIDKYNAEKEMIAEFYIDKVEKYLIPNLKKHIVLKDISTPATFERFVKTPTGSNYDMAPYPDNFGMKRLKMRTPIKNLFQPKFSHGIWPSMQAGLQVADMILKGKIMNGNSRYKKNNPA
jgi:phytoene dehydrogenase-like protein